MKIKLNVSQFAPSRWSVDGSFNRKNGRKFLTVLFAAGCLVGAHSVRAASWYLRADQSALESWSTLSSWWSTPSGVGTNPTSIDAADTFYTNGKVLRTPASFSGSTFPGKIVLSDILNIKSAQTSAAVGIANLESVGGTERTIACGANLLQVINVGAMSVVEHETTGFNTGGAAPRGLDITIGTLKGDGVVRLDGGGSLRLALGTAPEFYGKLFLSGSSDVRIATGWSIPGSLIINTGTRVTLDQNLTVSRLVVGGTVTSGIVQGGTIMGSDTTYTMAQLQATYPAIFVGGTGSITVTHPRIEADAATVVNTVKAGLSGVCASGPFWKSAAPNYRTELDAAKIGVVRIVGYPSQKGTGTVQELDVKVAQILNAGCRPLFIQCIDNPTHNPAFYNALLDLNGDAGTGGTVATNMAYLVNRYKNPPFNLTTQIWEVGNEPDIAVSYRVSSAQEYVDFYQGVHNQLVASGLRENVMLCGPVTSFDVGFGASYGWADGIMNAFLAACATPLNGYNQVDVVTRHVYAYIYTWEASPTVPDTAYNLLNAPCELVHFTQAQIDVTGMPARGEGAIQAKMNALGYPQTVGTGVTEMNVPDAYLHTITHGLWFLQYDHYALYNPRSLLANGFVFDATTTGNKLGFFKADRSRDYSFWAAYVHGNLTGDEVLNRHSTDHHLLVTATKDPHHVYVQVINRNTVDMSAELTLKNAPVSGPATLYTLSSTQTPDAGVPTTLGTTFTHTFPAMTAQVFRFARSDAPPLPPPPAPPPSKLHFETDFTTAPAGMATYYTGYQPTIVNGDLKVTNTTPNAASAVVFNGQALASAQTRVQVRFGFRVDQSYADGFVFGAYSSNPGAAGEAGQGLGYHGQSHRIWGVKVDNNPDEIGIVTGDTNNVVDGWVTQPLTSYSSQEMYMVIDYDGSEGEVRARLYQGTNDTGTLKADITNRVGNPQVLAAGTVFGFTGGTSTYSQNTLIHDLRILVDATDAPFVTGQTLSGTLQNTYNGWLGFKFTVGNAPITVSQVGRWVVSGNTGTHVVKLVNASTGLDVTGGAATVVTAGAAPGAFQYAALAQPVVLPVNTSYYLVSREPAGGDFYYTPATVLQHTGEASITSAAFGPGSATGWRTYSTSGHSYVPVTFKIQQ
jgi:hypothetical protein